MKNLNYIKIVSTMILLINLVEGASFVLNNGPSDIVTGIPPRKVNNLQTNLPASSTKLPTPHLEISRIPPQRKLVSPSLKNRTAQATQNLKQQKTSTVECSDNSLCASFDTNTTAEDVSAWMGFKTVNSFGEFFVATYGQKATHLGNNLYATEKWNQHHFWIHIGGSTVPLPMQPRFVAKDTESDREWYSVDYVGYQKQGIDYSKYSDGQSMSALILLIEPSTKEVVYSYLEYYDENDNYVDKYQLEIGDQIETYLLGYKKEKDDAVYLFNLETIKPIVEPVTFSYQQLYPGKDFNCTYCNEVDFEKVELQYIFESFTIERSSFTEPQAIEKSTNVVSSSKSVSISHFWIFFIFSMFIAMIVFKNENRTNKV